MSTPTEPQEVRWDEQRRAWIVKETEHFEVGVTPMLFNDRVWVSDKGNVYSYDHGWCYDQGGAAIIAALVWDPETQAMPTGWKKQATPGERSVP